jgi:sugar phosphate isomerase/epimerase
MLIGAMNHPANDIDGELAWMAEMGIEFVDLTLEPPNMASWRVNGRALRDKIEQYKFPVVGHTAYYLPLGSAIEDLRRGAVAELCRCIDIFAEVGAKWMNIHPDRHTPMHPRSFYIQRNIDTLGELLEHARMRGIGLMIENLPGDYNNAQQLGELLTPLPELMLHLDIGHANLLVPRNTTEEILDAFGSRLRHVHLHDNKGGHEDLHLPLGAGHLNLRGVIGALRASGYDDTITLEVFSPDRHYLAYSRDVLRRVWTEMAPRAGVHAI